MHKLPYEKFNEKYGAKSEEELKQAYRSTSFFVELLTDNLELEMVAILGGTFAMGCSANEGYEDEQPQHQVTVAPFFMSKYPITQAQWKGITFLPKIERDLNPNPSRFKGDSLPVESISWHDAVEFCQRLSQKTGRGYGLPSEAQWEYACRAGSKGKWCFGNDESKSGDYAWYWHNSNRKTHPVGEKKPNQWGLYDMHGNVWEWCADKWHDNYKDAPTDGSAWLSGNDDRSPLRGGSWIDYPVFCRSATRVDLNTRSGIFDDVGFRVVWGLGRAL